MDIIKLLAEEFKIRITQVENTITLIDEGNTIPFIARYRKELTGELDDQVLRELFERLTYLRNLEARKNEVIKLITDQGKMTDEILKSLQGAKSLQEVEDIYRPFKPKRKTRASVAREKGLQPLADILYSQELQVGDIFEIAAGFINPEKGVITCDAALAGAMDIIAETISDTAEFRKAIRKILYNHGIVVSKAAKEEDSVYAAYYDFKEPVNKIAKHRVLAINRGEKEDFLNVSINIDHNLVINYLMAQIVKKNSITTSFVVKALNDSYSRLISPSVEREIRNILTEMSQEQAIKIFAFNLKNLLLQPPIKGRVTLGLDPAYRTGCKIAVVDETGRVLDTTVIYPTPPQNKTYEAKRELKRLIYQHSVDLISIGNGTASKESEIFVVELIRELDRKVSYVVVNESGASVYSASKLAAQEFPEYDVSLRSAISIARRLQDPLAELVKIDPKSIGVGQYQHDMNQKKLGESLGGVVEDCVNSVGVDANTASTSLLSYIAGINSAIAKNIVAFRESLGKFSNRKQLKKVPKLGAKAFEQCAGFLRIPESTNVLDNTSVHPESYGAAEKLLAITGYTLDDVKKGDIKELKSRANQLGLSDIAEMIGIGLPTLRDIIDELLKPGRDPRDELPKPTLRTDIMDINDLFPSMILTGTVRNVIDFGAFVDIGVHQDGLVHISELSDKFVKHPMDVLSVGDIVKVKVLDVEKSKNRITLSIKQAK